MNEIEFRVRKSAGLSWETEIADQLIVDVRSTSNPEILILSLETMGDQIVSTECFTDLGLTPGEMVKTSVEKIKGLIFWTVKQKKGKGYTPHIRKAAEVSQQPATTPPTQQTW